MVFAQDVSVVSVVCGVVRMRRSGGTGGSGESGAMGCGCAAPLLAHVNLMLMVSS